MGEGGEGTVLLWCVGYEIYTCGMLGRGCWGGEDDVLIYRNIVLVFGVLPLGKAWLCECALISDTTYCMTGFGSWF